MTMNLIPRIQSVQRMPNSKHSTEDPNERRRRQLILTYGYSSYSSSNAESSRSPFNFRDTVEISEEGKLALAAHNHNL